MSNLFRSQDIFYLRTLTEYRIPISVLSVVVTIVVSSLVGTVFGTTPATFAKKLDPVESMAT